MQVNYLLNVQKNAPSMLVKYLLNVSSLDIIWSSFLFLTLNKFLRKTVLGMKYFFYLFWY